MIFFKLSVLSHPGFRFLITILRLSSLIHCVSFGDCLHFTKVFRDNTAGEPPGAMAPVASVNSWPLVTKTNAPPRFFATW
jgi:hypothetical protein